MSSEVVPNSKTVKIYLRGSCIWGNSHNQRFSSEVKYESIGKEYNAMAWELGNLDSAGSLPI